MVIWWSVNKAWARVQNAAAVSAAFVGEELGVGQPGVVVERGV